MHPITPQHLQSLGGIYFDNIQTGFHEYKHLTHIFDQDHAFEYFSNLCSHWDYKHCYADFYYYVLAHDERAIVDQTLNNDEINYLRKNSPTLFSNVDESIYNSYSDLLIFPLNPTLLEIICKLNSTATLFSTLYFTEIPSTYWGNYNQEYIEFS